MFACLAVPLLSPRRRRRLFLRDSRGAAAVEFAIVATPFLAFVVGIVEIGVDYYILSQVEKATQQAVLEIRTGAVQVRKLTRDQFKTEVFCPKLSLLDCDKAIINAVVVNNNLGWGLLSPTSIDPTSVKWCTGNPREVVLVQIAYPVPLSSMIWAGEKSSVNGQRYYLVSAGFRNEPFGVANVSGVGCA